MSYLIETSGLSKHYNEVRALEDFTIQISTGAIGLLGPNGAGKSTLIKLLLGLISPSSGTGRVFSYDIRNDPLNIRFRIGYMPENDCLLPDLNPVTYLSYLGQLSGLQPRDALQRAHETLYYVKIGDERYREIGTFSTGMRQRVKLAQALVHDPDLIFLDEPTSGLDPTGRRDMLELIKNIVQKMRKNIIFSTHILPDIEQVCDQVIIMNHGQLVKSGKLSELLYDKRPDLAVRIRGDEVQFIKQLEAVGLETIKRKNEIFIKYAPGHSKKIINIAARTNVQLRRLDKGKRSLEDLFINLLEETEGDN
jgi:ABC-2 type transport system ATP-binding protein